MQESFVCASQPGCAALVMWTVQVRFAKSAALLTAGKLLFRLKVCFLFSQRLNLKTPISVPLTPSPVSDRKRKDGGTEIKLEIQPSR